MVRVILCVGKILRVVLVICLFFLFRFTTHIQEIVQPCVRIKIPVEIFVLKKGVVCVLRGAGSGILRRQAQFFIGKFVQVYRIIIGVRAQKCLRIKTIFFFKVEIDIEIVLTHLCIPTFWYHKWYSQ